VPECVVNEHGSRRVASARPRAAGSARYAIILPARRREGSRMSAMPKPWGKSHGHVHHGCVPVNNEANTLRSNQRVWKGVCGNRAVGGGRHVIRDGGMSSRGTGGQAVVWNRAR